MQARLYTHQCTIKPSPIEPIREEPDHLPRHHRPRLPLAPAPPPPPPPLISTNTTAPVHINSRSVRSFSPLSLAHHQHQHVVLAHAPQRLVQRPRSRHKSHRLQDRHHWRRGKGHAQRNLPSRIHRRGYRHQKGQFSLIFFYHTSRSSRLSRHSTRKCSPFSTSLPAISPNAQRASTCTSSPTTPSAPSNQPTLQ